ncbi:MAG: CatB-related O-acetyltransferase [Mogibacterium sp.]|nr:CatB-related O-acetyltransferase [Mogibacterium sp.]
MMRKIQYYWSKLIKKLPGPAIKNSIIPASSKIEARSTVMDCAMGEYSYAGYGCTLLNCSIGNFCSIADSVHIGLGNDHPMKWVSTSPAFYYGRDSIPKDMAAKEFNHEPERTTIGHDVWIGMGVYIKEGVNIGTGAVIGMGSIVTADVPPYAIVAGVPARVIGYRFDEETVSRLLESKWWDAPKSILKKYAEHIDDVDEFIARIKEAE